MSTHEDTIINALDAAILQAAEHVAYLEAVRYRYVVQQRGPLPPEGLAPSSSGDAWQTFITTKLMSQRLGGRLKGGAE